MATVVQFRKWLEQFPDDTEVFVAMQNEPTAYQSYGSVRFDEPELKPGETGHGWDFTDFAGNQFAKPTDWFFGKKILNIGESR